jgi:hypothetical protein
VSPKVKGVADRNQVAEGEKCIPRRLLFTFDLNEYIDIYIYIYDYCLFISWLVS